MDAKRLNEIRERAENGLEKYLTPGRTNLLAYTFYIHDSDQDTLWLIQELARLQNQLEKAQEGCEDCEIARRDFALSQTFEYADKVAMLDEIKALQNQLVEANKMVGSRWISVEERLPEVDARVLVCFLSDKGTVGIEDCYMSGMRNRFVSYHTFEEVPPGITITHWQPLPQAPEKEAQA